MKLWIIVDNNILKIQVCKRRPGNAVQEIDENCPWVECYDLFIDEDGTKTVLINERRFADKMNQIAKEEYEFSKQK